jgi:hypothetical protein
MESSSSGVSRSAHPARLSVWIVGSFCVMVICACGSSSKPSRGAASGDPLLKLARCMRSHGVPNFPDPGARGLIIPDDVNTESPAFVSAQRTCADLGSEPGQSGLSQRAASPSEKLALLKVAGCMRSHGVPNFPDPTTSPPTPGSVSGNVIQIDGIYLAVGQPESPAFKRAATACGFRLP